MVPDIDLQLRAVIKALREVVADAVDPDNPAAQEQLRTSITTLELLADRHRLEPARAYREFANALAMAEAVAALTQHPDLTDALAEARQLSAQAEADRCDALKQALLAAVSHVVCTAQPESLRHAISAAVVTFSKAPCDLARAWYQPAGFETSDDEVKDLNALLGER
jgi:hypothetical protein